MPKKSDEMPASSKKHRFFRTFLLPVLLIFLLFGAAISGGLAYIFAKGGPAKLLEEALLRALPGLSVEIGQLDWAFHAELLPLSVKMGAVAVSYSGQQMRLPNAEMYFGMSGLVTGLPEKLSVTGLELDLYHDEGGWGLAEAGSDSKAGSGWLLFSGQPAFSADQQIGLRQIDIQASQLVITDASVSPPVQMTFNDSRLSLNARNPLAITGRLTMQQPQGGRVSSLFEGNLFSQYWQLDSTLTGFRPAGLDRLLPARLVPMLGARQIDGAVSLTLDGRQLELASGRLALRQGDLGDDLRRAGLPEAWAAYDRLGFDFAWSRADDLLKLTEAVLQLTDGHKLSLNGQLRDLSAPRLQFSGRLLAEDVRFQQLLSLWPDNQRPQAFADMEKHLASGRFATLLLETEASYDRAREKLDIAKLALNGAFDSARLSLSHSPYRSAVGTLSGVLDLKMGLGGQIDLLALDTRLAQGYISVETYPDAIAIKQARAQLRWQADQLNITGIELDLGPSGAAAFSGQLRLQDNQPLLLEGQLSSPQIDAEILKALWPPQFGRRTSAWVKKRFTGGQINGASLAFSYDFAAPPFRQVTAMSGQLQWQGVGYQWADNSPQITDTDFRLSIADDRLLVDIETGQLGEISLSGGRVEMVPVLGPPDQPRQVSMQGIGTAPVQAVRDFLLDESVQKLPQALAGLDMKAGRIVSRISASGLLQNHKLRIETLGSESDITGLSAAGLPMGHDLAAADIILSQTGSQLAAIGSGRVSGLPASFSVSSPDGRAASLHLRLDPDPGVTKILGDYTGLSLKGETGLQLAVGPAVKGRQQVDMTFMMDATGIDLPQISWAKQPGEPGRASLQLQLVNGRIEAAEDIDLALGSLSAAGRLIFANDGQLQGGFVAPLKLPGQDIDHLFLERLGDGTIQISAEGNRVDLTSLRRGDGLSEGRALTLDIIAGLIRVDDNFALSGHLVGATDKDGIGRVQLQGALLAEGAPLLSEASIEVRFGPQGERLSGVGLLGGGEAQLSFTPPQSGLPGRLEIKTGNAGLVLKGLEITDAILGGEMVLVNQFPSSDLSEFDTVIDITDFRVREAPAAVRAFSVLSLAGLYSLVEGDGTGFARGEARFSSKDGFHRIESVRASGAALGIAMVGSYDRNSRQVDVSGNLVPVNQLNEIIGSVPLLGELLTGVDKTGLFATQFTYRGSVDDPKVEVNPVSLLTPGLIRDLFSPDWLGSEADRILGPAAKAKDGQKPAG